MTWARQTSTEKSPWQRVKIESLAGKHVVFVDGQPKGRFKTVRDSVIYAQAQIDRLKLRDPHPKGR